MPDCLAQVCEVAADVFAVDPGSIRETTAPENLPQWDSVNHLNLALALEQAFGVELAPEDIDGMETIGAAAAIVSRKRQRSAG